MLFGAGVRNFSHQVELMEESSGTSELVYINGVAGLKTVFDLADLKVGTVLCESPDAV